MFKVGSIYATNKPFSNRENEKDAKERYFLYLGSGSAFDVPIYVYVATSTTQRHSDESNSINFYAKQFGFPLDCTIYFNDDIISNMTEQQFESLEPTEIGRLDKDYLLRVNKIIENVENLRGIVKKDIQRKINSTLIEDSFYK